MKTMRLQTILILKIILVLLMIQNQLSARDYCTVYIDSVANNDTAFVCKSVDTVRVIAPSSLTNCFFTYYKTMYSENMDTSYADTLFIKGNYGMMLMCKGFDGLNWQTKWIGIVPFNLYIFQDNYYIKCKGTVQLSVLLFDYKGKAKYHWQPETGVDNPSSLNPVIILSENTKYTFSMTTNGCTEKDSISLTLTPMDPPSICIVGVDENNKNRIVWERPSTESMVSYNIYKETNVTDVYNKIGIVDYDSSSIFTDTLSYPDIQSSKYKISINDACGIESAKSIPHKTMHLAVNQGLNNTINLIWEPYTGFTTSSYNIYRGTNPANLSLIGSTSGGSTQYSDLTPPSDNPYYQVEVIGPKYCNPNTKIKAAGISSSRSNIANLYTTEIKDLKNNEFSLVYPNPAFDLLSIVLKHNIRNGEIEISNLEGKQVLRKIIMTGHIDLNISFLPEGMYIIRITTGNEVKTGKFVKLK